jgi:hypothetical protein
MTGSPSPEKANTTREVAARPVVLTGLVLALFSSTAAVGVLTIRALVMTTGLTATPRPPGPGVLAVVGLATLVVFLGLGCMVVIARLVRLRGAASRSAAAPMSAARRESAHS